MYLGVTKDPPYKSHPHNLVGKEGCKKGVCTVFISNPDMSCSFTSLGIQCVKRKDVEESLRLRESIKVDPFKGNMKCSYSLYKQQVIYTHCNAILLSIYAIYIYIYKYELLYTLLFTFTMVAAGFGHKNQASNIDLNVVRLCFQVFIEGQEKDKFNVPLTPVVSQPIYDKKAMSELVISKLSHCSAPATGGTEVILLCDRVTKDDVQIRFYEERNGQVVWEGIGEFQPNDVHKQVAISFRTPRYFDENITHPITVMVMLRRPSDNQTSDPRPFQFLPRECDNEGLARKRQKVEEGAFERYLQHMPSPPRDHSPMNIHAPPSVSPPAPFTIRVPRLMPKVKHEIEHQSQQIITTHLTVPQAQQHTQQISGDTFWTLGLDQQQQQQQQEEQVTFLTPAPVTNALPFVKQESNILLTAASQLSDKSSSPFSGDLTPGPSYSNITKVTNSNIGLVEGPLTEKLDSLDLDIDPSDLINDINFNNMMVNLDSGNNITFNSSGNIAEANTQSATLNTPQIIDDNKNPLLPFTLSTEQAKR